ncbi:hypothetical protein DPMN_135425 [Dreissena polymorpha]|uniref:Uncharacterized protein n=1 Tax=Dreissena polymorpha TaxID=45954 RepID=A0A9D4G3W5_DREPO|nr:hypothetical protein DPMN_135425 [Dreissena polymorpha]
MVVAAEPGTAMLITHEVSMTSRESSPVMSSAECMSSPLIIFPGALGASEHM